MKFFITFLLALIASVNCVPSIVNTGSSAVTRSEDGHGNYAFGYNEDHATGGSFRKEKGGPGYQSGSYGLRDADGRMRIVSYVADAHGFRASVSTNEPGVDPKQDPAALNINGQHAAPVPVAHTAPVPMGHAAAVPLPPPASYPAYPSHVGPVTQSSYQISTTHISPAPIAHAAPAPLEHAAYPAAPVPIAPAAPTTYAEPVAHADPAPLLSHAAAAPIAHAAPAQLLAKAAFAEPIAHAAATPIVSKAYAPPISISPVMGKAELSGPLAGLAATYSIHTLG